MILCFLPVHLILVKMISQECFEGIHYIGNKCPLWLNDVTQEF